MIILLQNLGILAGLVTTELALLCGLATLASWAQRVAARHRGQAAIHGPLLTLVTDPARRAAFLATLTADTHSCPDCGTDLTDEGCAWWCANCKAVVSNIKVAAGGTE